MKNKICLICCRGGSQTIKDKNIKIFSGKPLLYWILKEAVNSKLFDQIILSTDSKKIAKVGKKFKILVPGLRPKYLAKNNSDQFETHKYIFKKLKISDKNSIVCILNNNPFISANLIKKSFDVYKKYKFKRIICDYAKVDGDYIANKQFIFKNKKINFLNKEKFINLKLNRQKLKSFYTYIFNIRWGKPTELQNYKLFKKKLSYNGYGIELSKLENFDIDDQYDWEISSTVFKYLKNARQNKFF